MCVEVVVFSWMCATVMQATVSIPSVGGATSSRRTLSVFSSRPTVRMFAWTAAPYATASSGLIDLFGSFSLQNPFSCWIIFLSPPYLTKPTNTPVERFSLGVLSERGCQGWFVEVIADNVLKLRQRVCKRGRRECCVVETVEQVGKEGQPKSLAQPQAGEPLTPSAVVW